MSAGILKIKIIGDDADLGKSLDGTTGRLGKFGALAAGAFALAGTAAVAAAGFAFKAGMDYDAAMDTIRVGTGATGAQLDALGGSFKTVFAGVPASAEQVGQAIADLNTRTQATGPALEALATQSLQLSKITGENLGSQIAATTRVFGDWSIASDKQSGAMDYLFKVSQNTGIGVTELSEKVVQFGAPLRQLGFDFETSAALMGKWEQEGVNLETVLAGMKIGLSNFAAAGIDAKEGLLQTIDAIKNAGSESEATGIAMEVFGKRAGPDMAAAIREGRFDLEDLLETLENSPETISAAAEATYDFGEKWVMLKNKISNILEPLGTLMMDVFGKAIDWVSDKMPQIEETAGRVFGAIADVVHSVRLAFNNFFHGLPAGAESLSGLSAAFSLLNPVMGIVKALLPQISQLLATLMPLVADLASRVLPLFEAAWNAVIAVITPVAEALLSLVEQVLPTLVEALMPVVETLIETFTGLMETLAPIITQIAELAAQLIEALMPIVTQVIELAAEIIAALMPLVTKVAEIFGQILQAVMPIIQAIVGFISEHWDKIKAVTDTVFSVIKVIVDTAMGVIQGVINVVMGLIEGDWSRVWEGIKGIAQSIWDGIKGLIDVAINTVKGVIETVLGVIEGIWNRVWGAVSSFVSGVWEGIKGAVSGAINTVKGTIDSVLTTIKGIWEGAWNGVRDFATDLWDGLSSTLSDIWNGIKRSADLIWTNIKDGIKKIVDFIPGDIKSALSTIVSTVTGPFQDAWDALKPIVGGIRSLISRINPGVRSSPSPAELILGGVQKLTRDMDAALGILERRIDERVHGARDRLASLGAEPWTVNASVRSGAAALGAQRQNNNITIESIVINGGREEAEEAMTVVTTRLAALGVGV